MCSGKYQFSFDSREEFNSESCCDVFVDSMEEALIYRILSPKLSAKRIRLIPDMRILRVLRCLHKLKVRLFLLD